MLPDLEVRPSPIHGVGVFAVDCIPANSKIAYYTGVEMTWAEIKERYGNNYTCIYRRMPWQTQIVSKEAKNVINFVNDGVHDNPTPFKNCILKNRWLISLFDIQKGEELLLEYPRNYWKHLDLTCHNEKQISGHKLQTFT